MKTFTFEVRHEPMCGFESLACEMAGRVRVYRGTGKVLAWTRWGARRLIRKLYGSRLIEIMSLGLAS